MSEYHVMMIVRYSLFYFLLSALASCQQQDPASPEDGTRVPRPDPLFTLMGSEDTGIDFVNTLQETEDWNILRYEYLFNGGGIAVGDVNGDALQDIYFLSNTGADKLYLNEGGFRFKDITGPAGLGRERGYKSGVTMVDINGDGHLDIHVCRDALGDPELRRNLLYVNNGDLTFTERSKEYGLDDASYSTQAYFFDMDLDGDLDMYLVNHPASMLEANNIKVSQDASGRFNLIMAEDLSYVSDRLYRNDDGRFKDITERAGVLNEAFGLSASIGDFNGDGFPDLYVCNDYVKPDQLWINSGTGSFADRFDEYFICSSFSTMGSYLADMNNDGHADLVTADMTARDRFRYHTLLMATNFDKYRKLLTVGLRAQFSANMLQLNNGNGSYSNIGHLSGVAYTDWSWSTLFADLDNDGWKDLLVSNGYFRDVSNNDYQRYTMDSLQKELRAGNISLTQWTAAIPSVKVSSFLFRNEGDLTFSDRSQEWNAGPPAFSNGAVYADLDNDGHLDLVMNNINEPAFLMRNNGAEQRGNGYIRVSLDAGPGQTAIGSKVELWMSDGSKQTQWLQPTRGFLSCSEAVSHFGLGTNNDPDRLEITWPNGDTQVIPAPKANMHHIIARAQDMPIVAPPPAPGKLFTDRSKWLPSSMQHVENDYIDLKREPLLRHFLSQEGPGAAVADVNGDGLEDIFLGGSMGKAGKLFLQVPGASFREIPLPDLENDKDHEDVAALFFDADGDGDQDLYVASGGNERPKGDRAYADRLYLNDGRGAFSKAVDALPPAFNSSGCIAATDMDGDGDMDLFVGGRQTPGRYPETPASQILRNNGGRFVDITDEWSEGLQHVGMVTDADFADLDGDGSQELVLVGEWMPVSVFKKRNGRFENATEAFGLSDSNGWWCSLAIGDLDSDGLPEILAGNTGLNSPLNASVKAPLTLHYKDFDGNGSLDAVLCSTENGRNYPVHNRDRMLDQMIMLKKRFLRYHTYAQATLEEVFKPQELDGAGILRANTLASTLFRNKNGERFEAEVLPNRVQLSMAHAMLLVDVDGDGLRDAIVAGNHYGTDAQFGRYDASIGLLMKNEGKGVLAEVAPDASGLSLRGQVRDLLPITLGGKACLLVVRNNEPTGAVELLSAGPLL